jgi:ubiquinone/menaquinone biosynthesis C-methylase UbiE
MKPPTERYPLGHSPAELERQVHQARHLRDHTAILLKHARLLPGQQVLDIGCGLGDVTLIAAEFVGPRGFVVGVDRSEVAVRAARERALDAGVSNVEFVVGDVDVLNGHRAYDCIVGRLITMYLPNPVVTLSRLRMCIRPGGSLVLQEIDIDAVSTTPRCELVEQAKTWAAAAFRCAGANPNTGTSLHQLIRAADFETRGAFASQPTFTPASAVGGLHWFAETIRTLLPVLERHSICTAAEVDIETLGARMQAEMIERDAVVFGPRLVGVWARA